MPKMYYFTNIIFKNRQVLGVFRPLLPLTFNIGYLQFHDLAKLCFFKQIMTKLNFKSIVMTLFQ